MSQHEDRPKRRPLLLLSGLPRSSLGREGPGRARGAPLGDVLTPRERALLRGPAASRPAERGEPSPPRGDPWEPELLEAHQRHVAEIRARTQQLEQQRERRHRHRVRGDRCGSGVTRLCVPQSCASAWHCCATTVCHQKRAGLRRRCQTKLDTSTEGLLSTLTPSCCPPGLCQLRPGELMAGGSPAEPQPPGLMPVPWQGTAALLPACWWP